ncbi:hypothetical protein CU039_1389 [Enterococcus faecium]|nr:hypothetical protein [Enterococcus faecium]
MPGTTAAVYKKVFFKEIQNVSSLAILRKLSSPANSGVEKESHFINASTSENMIGINVKTKKPMKFGAINE